MASKKYRSTNAGYGERKGGNMDEKIEESMNGILEKLTDEQREQTKTCKTMDEFMKLVGEWGIELPDELADAVVGGACPTDETWEEYTARMHQFYRDHHLKFE